MLITQNRKLDGIGNVQWRFSPGFIQYLDRRHEHQILRAPDATQIKVHGIKCDVTRFALPLVVTRGGLPEFVAAVGAEICHLGHRTRQRLAH
jgi:hypothetical protein